MIIITSEPTPHPIDIPPLRVSARHSWNHLTLNHTHWIYHSWWISGFWNKTKRPRKRKFRVVWDKREDIPRREGGSESTEQREWGCVNNWPQAIDKWVQHSINEALSMRLHKQIWMNLWKYIMSKKIMHGALTLRRTVQTSLYDCIKTYILRAWDEKTLKWTDEFWHEQISRHRIAMLILEANTTSCHITALMHRQAILATCVHLFCRAISPEENLPC